GMPPSDHTTAPTVDQSGDQADADQAARIKAEVDNAPPFSARQREYLRRIFATARATAARDVQAAEQAAEDGPR
ncbi:hypothetical protein, partial [Actinomadura rubrisoli]|uniref:hypothetical protein n=1 Tax=Actinomadura rubrisoli TaxID=2530368 RepID=UPI001404F137